MTDNQVAKILNLTRSRVKYLTSLYFQEPLEYRRRTIVPRYNPGDRSLTEANMKNITDDESTWIVDQDNLAKWAHLSLKSRATLFHRKFPDRWIQPRRLREVMRLAGITMKGIKIRRAPARKELSLDEYGEDILNLDDKIRALPADSHLVFADECVFTARGF
jgi:hypothetical protein